MSLAILSNRIVAFNNLKLSREALLKFLLLGVIEIFIFEDLVELVAQVFILDQDLRHSLTVEQRDRRAIGH
jgi:hypothetical protein